MKAIWQGAAIAPSTSATNYTFITASLSTAWETVETVYTGQMCVVPLSENITVTKLTVWVTTAPGSGKSWAFTVRANLADTSATVIISNTNTTASWSGSVRLSQLDLVALASVPSGTPTGTGNIYWTIEYSTGGNYYLIPGGFGGTNNNGTFYLHPIRGVNSTQISGLSSLHEAVIPAAITVKRFAVNASIGPGYFDPTAYTDYYVRNASTGIDSSFYVHLMSAGSATNVSAISPAGSISFSAGDRMVIKLSNPNAAWSGNATCMTVVPGATGEVINAAYGQTNAPSTSITNYQEVAGGSAWNSAESNVYEKTGAGTIKSLYVWQTNAPGIGNSYAYTIRQNGSDSSVTTSISDASTTANDTAHSFSASDGDFVSVKSVPSGTPSATGTLRISYVLAVSQTGINSSVKGISSVTGITSITL